MQFEFSTFAELPEAGTQADEVWTSDRNTELHRRLGDVVDSVFMEAETVWLVMSIYEVH